MQPKSSAPKLDLDTGISLRNKANYTITPKIQSNDQPQKKFEIDKLSKFINLQDLDMKKFKGGEKNFSGLLDDVTFIADPQSAEPKGKIRSNNQSGS